MRKLNTTYLKVILLSLAALLILELTARLPTPEIPIRPEKAASPRRVMLFEHGENFQNIDKHFRYFPNKTIRSETYYVSENSSHKEYSSVIVTNNLGVVQKRDIVPGSTVELIVGDSFGEGQGATPWFYKFDDYATSKGKTFANGSLLGTSPMQWEMFTKKIEADFNIKYKSVNIVLLGGGITGGVWQFDDNGLQCLRTANCKKPFGDFFGYDFHQKNDEQIRTDALYLHNIASQQLNNFQENLTIHTQKVSILQRMKDFLKQSTLMHKYGAYIKKKILRITSSPPEKNPITGNLEALRRLVNAGEKQGFIILVTTKHEAGFPPQWDPHTLQFMEYARQHDMPYEICELRKEDFLSMDGHPHAGGYDKIRACVEKAAQL